MLQVFFCHKRALFFLLYLSIGIAAGCGTVERGIETPFGPTPDGKVFTNLQVIGILNLETGSGNQTDSFTEFTTTALVEVPVGTVLIVPAVRGWSLAFGELEPDLSGIKYNDHHYGVGGVKVMVTKVNPVNTVVTPPTQTAEITLQMALADHSQDDRWFGTIAYTLICFGLPSGATGGPLPLDPPRVVICPENQCPDSLPPAPPLTCLATQQCCGREDSDGACTGQCWPRNMDCP